MVTITSQSAMPDHMVRARPTAARRRVGVPVPEVRRGFVIARILGLLAVTAFAAGLLATMLLALARAGIVHVAS
jgi:hypothetical protein